MYCLYKHLRHLNLSQKGYLYSRNWDQIIHNEESIVTISVVTLSWIVLKINCFYALITDQFILDEC